MMAEKLLEEAVRARLNAYAPYSRFLVGASIETENGNVYSGCNVENASYGLTDCAEASAISAMVTAGERKIKQMTVVTDASELTFACGACRQRIYEFASPETIVHFYNLSGKHESKKIKDLLPNGFGPKDLLSDKE